MHALRGLSQQRACADRDRRGQPCREIEVGDDKSEVFVDEEIFRFDVSVDDSYLLVQVLQAVHQLLEQISNEGLRQSLINLDQSVELAVLGEVHHVVADRPLSLHGDRFDVVLRAVAATCLQSVFFGEKRAFELEIESIFGRDIFNLTRYALAAIRRVRTTFEKGFIGLTYGTKFLDDDSVKVGSLDLDNVLVVAVGEYRNLAEEPLQALMLAEFRCASGLNFKNFDRNLALGLKVQRKFDSIDIITNLNPCNGRLCGLITPPGWFCNTYFAYRPWPIVFMSR